MNHKNKNKDKVEDNTAIPQSQNCECKDNNGKCDCESNREDESNQSKDKIAALETENSHLKNKLSESNDKFLRLFAEFDNFRKRTATEKADIIKNGSEKAIKSMLPVIDDFERAIKALKDSNQNDALEGIELIYNKFMTTLEKGGLKPMECLGMTFDTDLHEAITSMPTEDKEMKGKIGEVLEKGYTLNDKVIRFAKVIIMN